MVTKENMALIPYKELPTISLNWYDLHQYFSYSGLRSPERFPRLIDLTMISDVMDYLYQNAQLAYVLPEEERQKQLDRLDSMGEPVTDTQREMREWISQEILTQAVGERHVVIYEDPDDDLTKVTPVAYGEVNEVRAFTYDLLRAGKVPLIDLHTHPFNNLPSPTDYLGLIADLGHGGGALKGHLVLCPDNQILALATDRTLRLPFAEAEGLIAEWDKEFQRPYRGRLGQLERRLNNLQQRLLKRGAEVFDREISTMANYEDRMHNGELTEGEFWDLVEIYIQGDRIALEEEIERFDPIFNKAKIAYDNLVSRFTNELLIEFARLVNVKLYYSTNRKDFKEFTA